MQLDQQTQLIREKWDNFSESYTEQIAPSLSALGYGLVAQLALTSAQSPLTVLESGCGPGVISQMCARLLPPGSKYYVTDLSEKMIETCKKNFSSCENKQISIDIRTENAEHLTFESATFDRFFANMCLQLVSNSKQMMAETYRVLKPGAIAAFSVWGRKINSPFINIVEQTVADLGVNFDPTIFANINNNFHLGEDLERTRKTILEVGFSRAIAYYQNMVYDVMSGEDFTKKIFAGMYRMVPKSLPEQKFTELRNEISKRAQEWIDQGHAIQLDCAVIVAVK